LDRSIRGRREGKRLCLSLASTNSVLFKTGNFLYIASTSRISHVGAPNVVCERGDPPRVRMSLEVRLLREPHASAPRISIRHALASTTSPTNGAIALATPALKHAAVRRISYCPHRQYAHDGKAPSALALPSCKFSTRPQFKFPVTIPAIGPGQIRNEKLAVAARSTLRACSNCEKQHAGDG
jgi:hypothetical protein